MGHIRLGRLPRTKKWREVIALIGEGTAPPNEVVEALARAAEARLRTLENDPALSYLYWLLTRVTWLARRETFVSDLEVQGVRIPEDVSGLTFLGKLGELASKELRRRYAPSILSELALRAFKAALGEAVYEKATTLFGTSLEDVRLALRQLSSPREFSHLVRAFFAAYLSGIFEFFLSKEASNHVGWTRGFSDPRSLAEFQGRLRKYCYEITQILADFSGEWYSKHNWLDDIDEGQARRFVAYAITKVRSEIGREVVSA